MGLFCVHSTILPAIKPVFDDNVPFPPLQIHYRNRLGSFVLIFTLQVVEQREVGLILLQIYFRLMNP